MMTALLPRTCEAGHLTDIYTALGERECFTLWGELEDFATGTLTVPERAEVYLELSGVYSQGMASANADRLRAMLEYAIQTDRAAYRDELWRWMMDNARWEFADYLIEKEGY